MEERPTRLSNTCCIYVLYGGDHMEGILIPLYDDDEADDDDDEDAATRFCSATFRGSEIARYFYPSPVFLCFSDA